MPDEFEPFILKVVFYVLDVPGKKIIRAYHVVAFFQKEVAKVRPDKTRAACNYYLQSGPAFSEVNIGTGSSSNAVIPEAELFHPFRIVDIPAVEHDGGFHDFLHLFHVKLPEILPTPR